MFCPQQCRTGANRNTGGNTGFLFADGPLRQNENGEEQTIRDAGGQGGQLSGQGGLAGGQGGQLGGGLGLTFGQGVREVVKNVPETVKDSVRELLSGRK